MFSKSLFSFQCLNSFSFVLIQKKQKIKANPNGSARFAGPCHGTRMLLIISIQMQYRVFRADRLFVQLKN
jgi:hypothetical protein